MATIRHICTLEQESNCILPPLPQKASLFQRIRRRLKMCLLISQKNPRCKLYFKSNAAVINERNRHIMSRYTYIIHPFSEFRVYWEIWMIIAFSTSLVYLPYFISFNYLDHYNYPSLTTTGQRFSTFLDFACMADVIVTFFTGYVLDDIKEVVLIRRKIVLNYVCSWSFPFDVLASMPFELISFLIYASTTEDHLDKYFEIISLLKIFRLYSLLTYMSRVTDLWHIPQKLFTVVRYLFLIFLVIHWTACLHYLVPVYYFSFVRNLDKRSWVVMYEVIKMPTWRAYVRCILRATLYLLCVTPGAYPPNTTEDVIVGIVTFLVGNALVGVCTVLLLQIVLSRRTAETKYQAILSQLREYMRHKQLPIDMQQRLVKYYEYKYQKRYFREKNITSTLSARLLREINVHICKRLVENVSILKDLPAEAVSDIISALKAEVYLPNDIIVRAGSVGDCMYFLATGTVAVCTPTGKEVCHLQDGAYFGEIALIMKDKKRVATVIALEICELYRLDRKSFLKCFRSTPALYKKIEQRAEARKGRTLILEEMHKKYLTTQMMAPNFDPS